jgi:hypothetical protein
MACSSCSSSPCSCEALQIPRGPRGFTGPAGPAPALTFAVETLPPTDDATLTTTGGAGAYNLLFGIPRGATGPQGPAGANGTNGIAYTTLTAAFTQPAIGDLVTLTVGSTAFMELGQPIFVGQGGSYIAASNPLSATQIIVVNPGPVEGYPAGVVGQTAPGATVPVSGSLSQVTSVGRPGRDGADGAAGAPGVPGPASIIALVTTIPTLPPAPGGESVVYTDSLVTPTVFQFYFYKAGSWSAGPNILGAPGTLTVNTAGDPNVTLPAGPVGTYAYRTDAPSLYVKTGAATWLSLFTFIPTLAQVTTASSGLLDSVTMRTNRVIGMVPLAVSVTSVITHAVDLAYGQTDITSNKNITLNWDNTNYTHNAQWVVTLTNNDAAPIAVAFTAARWFKKTGLSLPSSLTNGATQYFLIVKTPAGLCITDTAVVLAV